MHHEMELREKIVEVPLANPLVEKQKSKFKKWAFLLVIIAAALWGTIGIFVKKLDAIGFNPLQIVFLRAFSAMVLLFIFLLIKNPKLICIKLKHSFYFIGTGIFSFAFFNWCYFESINRISLAVAAILLYTAPSIVTILSVILFKEKLTSKKIISLLLTFLGCILVTAFGANEGKEITALGLLIGLGAGVGYALYTIFGRYALEKYDTMTVTLYTFIFATIGLIPLTDLGHMVQLFHSSFSFSGFDLIYLIFTLGLLGSVLPYLLYTKGLTYLESSKASIISTLEPVVATIIGITLFDESITLFKIAGVSLVIYAVFLLREKKEA